MNSRDLDLFILLCRVHEKRGRIRALLRSDPEVQPQVQSFLDDLTWLSSLRPLMPRPGAVAVNKERLLGALQSAGAGHRRLTAGVVGRAVAGVLLLGFGVGFQIADAIAPVHYGDAVLHFVTRDERQVRSSALFETHLSTPADVVLEAAAPGFN